MPSILNAYEFSSGSINQEYHFRADEFSKLDVIYSKNEFFQDKFDPIRLFEYLGLLKNEGLLIIQSSTIHPDSFGSIAKYQFCGSIQRFSICDQSTISTSELDFLRCKNILIDDCILLRKNFSFYDVGNIGEITFGIVTNGHNDSDVDEAIKSIIFQNIPSVQIIVCGTYENKYSLPIDYIHFNCNDDRGWITKKKNIIVENAKFENVVIFHDRLKLAVDWYKSLCDWGNGFEILCASHLYQNKQEFLPSWYRYKFDLNNIYKWNVPIAKLQKDDWDPYILDCGSVLVAKRTILNSYKFNEDLFWGQFEDCELSKRLADSGFIFRYSHNLIFLSSRKSLAVFIKRSHAFNSQKLGKIKNRPLTLHLFYCVLDFLSIRRNSYLSSKIVKYVISRLGSIKTHRSLNEDHRS